MLIIVSNEDVVHLEIVSVENDIMTNIQVDVGEELTPPGSLLDCS